MKKLILITTGLIVALSQSAFANTQTYTATVLSGKIKKSASFTCTDDIYIYHIADANADETKTVKVSWIDPLGDRVRLQERSFENTGSGQYVWDGITIEGGGGSGLSGMLTGLFDPSAGYEDVIGEWTIKLELPQGGVEKIQFDVLC
ncbi:MAG: hypothetical protein AAF402_03780 [Pseudomonadota bacterium]